MDVTFIANLLFLFSIIFIAIGITRANQLAIPPKETIRYIPRSLEEEQNEPVKAEQIFKSMFEQQTPWIGVFNDSNIVQRRELDKDRGILSKNKINQLINKPINKPMNKPMNKPIDKPIMNKPTNKEIII